jgi:hypothetical protein
VQNFAVANTEVFYIQPQDLFLFDSDDALVEWQSTRKS